MEDRVSDDGLFLGYEQLSHNQLWLLTYTYHLSDTHSTHWMIIISHLAHQTL